MSQVARRDACPGIFPGMHDARVEGSRTTAQCIKRKRRGNVSRVCERVRFAKCKTEKREHSLRAVQQGQSFFGLQSHWSDPGSLHGLGPAKLLSLVSRLAFADDYAREMRQRRQIARRAYGTLRG